MIYWLYNPPTNSSVTISKAGKAPQIISGGEVAVIFLAKGEELALSGTSGQTLSIYDHFDVKLIPAAKEVLGTVKIGDGTNTAAVVNAPLANQYGINVYIDPSEAVNVSSTLGIAQGADTSFQEFQDIGIISVANATAETVKATGAINANVKVTYALSAGPPTLATSTDTLTYVAIKGATTAKYYAVAFLGMSVTGNFMLVTQETINIVVRNQDTVAHAMAGSFRSTAP